MTKLLAIDYGQHKIGLAVADTDIKIALPLEVVKLAKLATRIRELIVSDEVKKIVVGLPLGLNGQETAQTAAVRKFVTDLKSKVNVEIVTEDERLTSVQASRVKKDDAVAAMYILQSYLDKNYG